MSSAQHNIDILPCNELDDSRRSAIRVSNISGDLFLDSGQNRPGQGSSRQNDMEVRTSLDYSQISGVMENNPVFNNDEPSSVDHVSESSDSDHPHTICSTPFAQVDKKKFNLNFDTSIVPRDSGNLITVADDSQKSDGILDNSFEDSGKIKSIPETNQSAKKNLVKSWLSNVNLALSASKVIPQDKASKYVEPFNSKTIFSKPSITKKYSEKEKLNLNSCVESKQLGLLSNKANLNNHEKEITKENNYNLRTRRKGKENTFSSGIELSKLIPKMIGTPNFHNKDIGYRNTPASYENYDNMTPMRKPLTLRQPKQKKEQNLSFGDDISKIMDSVMTLKTSSDEDSPSRQTLSTKGKLKYTKEKQRGTKEANLYDFNHIDASITSVDSNLYTPRRKLFSHNQVNDYFDDKDQDNSLFEANGINCTPQIKSRLRGLEALLNNADDVKNNKAAKNEVNLSLSKAHPLSHTQLSAMDEVDECSESNNDNLQLIPPEDTKKCSTVKNIDLKPLSPISICNDTSSDSCSESNKGLDTSITDMNDSFTGFKNNRKKCVPLLDSSDGSIEDISCKFSVESSPCSLEKVDQVIETYPANEKDESLNSIHSGILCKNDSAKEEFNEVTSDAGLMIHRMDTSIINDVVCEETVNDSDSENSVANESVHSDKMQCVPANESSQHSNYYSDSSSNMKGQRPSSGGNTGDLSELWEFDHIVEHSEERDNIDVPQGTHPDKINNSQLNLSSSGLQNTSNIKSDLIREGALVESFELCDGDKLQISYRGIGHNNDQKTNSVIFYSPEIQRPNHVFNNLESSSLSTEDVNSEDKPKIECQPSDVIVIDSDDSFDNVIRSKTPKKKNLLNLSDREELSSSVILFDNELKTSKNIPKKKTNDKYDPDVLIYGENDTSYSDVEIIEYVGDEKDEAIEPSDDDSSENSTTGPDHFTKVPSFGLPALDSSFAWGKKRLVSDIPLPGHSPSPDHVSFLLSLCQSVPDKMCHPDAIKYKDSFSRYKNNLIDLLFKLYNQEIFDNKMPLVEIKWSGRLTTTSGITRSTSRITPSGKVRTSGIKLSKTIVDNASKLRDVLLHEMCHAANWLIDEQSGGHGPLFRKWADQARFRFPEIPRVNVCHRYELKWKYIYKCTNCGYEVGKMKLSLKEFCCGLCGAPVAVLS